MNCEKIEARLTCSIGLDVRSMGSLAVPMATEVRMKKCGITEAEDYAALLGESDAELQNLVEELVVPETWFFRDNQPFLALREWAANVWFPSNPGQVLRLLSMPCSTGEEPFSMVMALLEAGISPDRFVVEAVDISRVALERARQGIYSQNSFRGQQLAFRDKYFQPVPQGWQLAEEVRRQVQFRQANVLDPAFSARAVLNGVIFCRNMLIYFAPEAQKRVMAMAKEMLSRDGLLFVGYAEAYIFSGFGFESAGMPMAFCFRKGRAAGKKASGAVASSSPRSAEAEPFSGMPFVGKTMTAEPAAPPVHANPSDDPEALLAEGQRLADAGCFEAASEKCRAFLRERGPSSRAYCLLGLVNDACGKSEEAGEFYRKALYLEPDHPEALIHLSLLSEKCGNPKAALRLRQRALRAHRKPQKQEGSTNP